MQADLRKSGLKFKDIKAKVDCGKKERKACDLSTD